MMSCGRVAALSHSRRSSWYVASAAKVLGFRQLSSELRKFDDRRPLAGPVVNDPLRPLARSGANSSYLDSEQFRSAPKTG
jgi:hypothetical protein